MFRPYSENTAVEVSAVTDATTFANFLIYPLQLKVTACLKHQTGRKKFSQMILYLLDLNQLFFIGKLI